MTRPEDIDPAFKDNFDSDKYNDHHYSDPIEADILVTRGIVTSIALKLGQQLHTFDSLFEVGTGATLRTSGMASPLLAPSASVKLTDVGEPQIKATETAVRHVRQGNMGMWEAHQAIMASTHPIWRNAISDLCDLEVSFGYHNIRETPVPPTRLRVEGHTLCSNTNNAETYRHTLHNFVETMEPGDVAIRLFDVMSTKYIVDEQEFEGYPIDANTIRNEASELGLDVLSAFEYPTAVTVDNAELATKSTLSALGGAVLLKPSTTTVIV